MEMFLRLLLVELCFVVAVIKSNPLQHRGNNGDFLCRETFVCCEELETSKCSKWCLKDKSCDSVQGKTVSDGEYEPQQYSTRSSTKVTTNAVSEEKISTVKPENLDKGIFGTRIFIDTPIECPLGQRLDKNQKCRRIS